MQSRMEFKEATFYKASSSFHYKGKGSILKPHTCCEYPDSLLEDGTPVHTEAAPAGVAAPQQPGGPRRWGDSAIRAGVPQDLQRLKAASPSLSALRRAVMPRWPFDLEPTIHARGAG